MIRLGDLIKSHEQDFLYSGRLDKTQFKTFRALSDCRQASAKKGVLYSCDKCHKVKFIYKSCGNRFCPNCQNHRTSQWLYGQKQKLLPCVYYMITFTLPREFRRVPRTQLWAFYKAFFDCSSQALKALAKDRLGGELGMLGVLHTNTRKLEAHPHIHYLIPGVVFNQLDGTVKKVRNKYLLGFSPLAKLFRGKFLAELKRLGISFPDYLYGKEWKVNSQAKGDGKGVLEYLSRYLVKGVVSQHALNQKGENIELTYRENKTQQKRKIVMSELELLKRLSHHVLPKGFRSVREYGFLAPPAKKKLIRMQLLLDVHLEEAEPPILPKPKCPCCQGPMSILLAQVSARWVKARCQAHLGLDPPRKVRLEG